MATDEDLEDASAIEDGSQRGVLFASAWLRRRADLHSFHSIFLGFLIVEALMIVHT